MYISRFLHFNIFQKKAAQNGNFFIFLKSRYFWLGSRRKMDLDTFWETYLGFLEMLFHNFSHKIAKFISI